jgi:hypothetical protein
VIVDLRLTSSAGPSEILPLADPRLPEERPMNRPPAEHPAANTAATVTVPRSPRILTKHLTFENTNSK